MSIKHLCLLSVAAMIGCASGSNTRTPSSPRMARILSADEVFAAKADIGSAYDALARLRPNWLAVHGVSSFDNRDAEYAEVYVDGQHHGNLQTLKNIAATDVRSFKYYDVTEAGGTFGLRAGTGGVIALTLKVRE
jgi:hypothetical protein